MTGKPRKPATALSPPAGPGVDDPSLEEPTAPVPPPAPKPSQRGPEPVTPTGASTGAPQESNAQQGEYLTTSVGLRLRNTDQSLKAGPRGHWRPQSFPIPRQPMLASSCRASFGSMRPGQPGPRPLQE